MAHFFVSRARKWAAKKFENCFKTDAEQRAEECFSFFFSLFASPPTREWEQTTLDDGAQLKITTIWVHYCVDSSTRRCFFLFCLLIEGSRVWPSWTHQHRGICRESSACKHINKILNRLRSAEDSQEQMSRFSMSNHSRMWSVHETLIATVSTFLFFLVPLIGGASIQINRKTNELQRCYFIFFLSKPLLLLSASPELPQYTHIYRLYRLHADADIQRV